MGELAFHPSPVLDPPYQLMGSINWGDGTTSKGTEQLTAGSDAIGYETIGSHTYTKAGTFKIVTTLSLVSILPPPTLPTIIVSKIDSTAIVAKSQSPLGGVQFSVFANQQFTEKVGTFAFNNTNLALSASIDWGDGVTSAGTITRTTGDVYKVVGTHTYSHKGTYKPHIIVTARPVSVPGEPTPLFIVLVASFHSIIDVKALT